MPTASVASTVIARGTATIFAFMFQFQSRLVTEIKDPRVRLDLHEIIAEHR